MKLSPNLSVAAIAGLIAMGVAIATSDARAQGDPMPIKTVEALETAVFAGGCFWCVESDFDKVDGVIETLSGYTGGDSANPTYKSHGRDGHLEAVQITFDPAEVSYADLVAYFFRHIDPTDDGGQFCDRGNSYRTAVFALDNQQADIAEAEKATIAASGILDGPVVTQVRAAAPFWPAEDYHQDYYLKNPVKYRFYRQACGRDQRIKELWGSGASG